MINFKFLCCTFSAFSPTIWLCTIADVSRVMQWNSPILHTELSDNVERRATDDTMSPALANVPLITSEVLLLFPGQTLLYDTFGPIKYQLRLMDIDVDAGLRHTDVAKFTPPCLNMMSTSPTISAV